MEFLQQWASLVLSVMAIGGTVWAWISSGSKDAHKRLDKMEDDRARTADAIVARFQLVENRLTKLESDFEHMPDREQVHRIELGLERLNGRMETLDERLKPVAAVAMRLQEFELEKANGK